MRAKELKAAGMDWTEVLAAEIPNKRSRLAAELLGSPGTTEERVKAFVGQGGGCKATFFNYRRYLLQKIMRRVVSEGPEPAWARPLHAAARRIQLSSLCSVCAYVARSRSMPGIWPLINLERHITISTPAPSCPYPERASVSSDEWH